MELQNLMTYFIWRKGAFRNPNWQANKLDISGVVPENSEKKNPEKRTKFQNKLKKDCGLLGPALTLLMYLYKSDRGVEFGTTENHSSLLQLWLECNLALRLLSYLSPGDK